MAVSANTRIATINTCDIAVENQAKKWVGYRFTRKFTSSVYDMTAFKRVKYFLLLSNGAKMGL
jgi:hypothetical protein